MHHRVQREKKGRTRRSSKVVPKGMQSTTKLQKAAPKGAQRKFSAQKSFLKECRAKYHRNIRRSAKSQREKYLQNIRRRSSKDVPKGMQNLHRKISGKETSVIPKGMKVMDVASYVCVWTFICTLHYIIHCIHKHSFRHT
jgi:hypothetical protein